MWRTWVVHFYGVSRRMGTDLGGGEVYVLQGQITMRYTCSGERS